MDLNISLPNLKIVKTLEELENYVENLRNLYREICNKHTNKKEFIEIFEKFYDILYGYFTHIFKEICRDFKLVIEHTRTCERFESEFHETLDRE